VLGSVHTVNCAVVYLTVGLAARTVLRARPSIARAVTRCSGIAMIAIAVVLLAERALGH
jgi:threonine/homoserine/homoserine lactone efflux protein